jgi:hypothetical protein
LRCVCQRAESLNVTVTIFMTFPRLEDHFTNCRTPVCHSRVDLHLPFLSKRRSTFAEPASTILRINLERHPRVEKRTTLSWLIATRKHLLQSHRQIPHRTIIGTRQSHHAINQSTKKHSRAHARRAYSFLTDYQWRRKNMLEQVTIMKPYNYATIQL